jgi:hypothetical protein
MPYNDNGAYYDDTSIELERLRKAQADRDRTDTANADYQKAYDSGDYNYIKPDYSTQAGMAEGKGKLQASQYYGKENDIGSDSRSYSQMLKDSMNGNSVDADAFLSEQGKKAGLNDARAQFSGINNSAMSEQNRRNTMFEADKENQNYKDKAKLAYGKDIGRRISGTETLKGTAKSEELAGRNVASVDQSSGTLSCAVLVTLGLMSKETYALEAQYINKESYQYIGYCIITALYLPMFFRSKFFAKGFSYFAHKYVYNLTGIKKNLIGRIIESIGGSFCSIIGFLSKV